MGKELPKGWVVSTIEDSIEILDNKRKPVSANERAKRIGDVPYYGATGIAGSIDDYLFDEELVLLGEDGAPFLDRGKNVAYLISGKSWVNNHAHVLKAKSITSNKFLLHYLNQFDYTNYVGGTTRLKLNQGYLKLIPFPLPPLPEQERIVAKLDSLFEHIENTKTRLAKVPTLLKNFRQAVLTQAVTGKLTECIGWKKVTLDQLINKSSNGLSKRSGIEGEKIVVLRLADFKNAIRNKGKERTIVLTNKERENYDLRNQDVLVIRVNGSVDLAGRFILYKKEEIEESFCDHFIRYRFDDELNPQFIIYIANSGEGRKYLFDSLSTSAGQNTINQKSIGSLEFLLPPIQEQTEIVSRVESLFAKADAIEAKYKLLKEKIDNLPQTILSKAFKGELVGQLESDGDARELLEEIKKLKLIKE